MPDTDLIACLYPLSGPQQWNPAKASALYVSPNHPKPTQSAASDSSRFPNLPRFEIRFSNVPPSPHGVVFGCHPKSDVVLPSNLGLDKYHLGLTFDDANCLIVRDWGSDAGTKVTYNGYLNEARHGFEWIVGGHPTLMANTMTIEIMLGGLINFRIVAVNHDVTSPAYIANVNRFRQGTATVDSLFQELDILSRLITERPKNWNPNIVQLLEATFDEWPKLYLEYIPGGSLADCDDISVAESVSVLQQCLSALKYLHGLKPPVAHRDIKAANILVQWRRAGQLLVKFGDFGLAKDSGVMMSFCGTRQYMAPEIYQDWNDGSNGKNAAGYSVAVDIWSLGVVIYKLVCGLPQGGGMMSWCKRVVSKLERDFAQRPDELKELLLTAMVVLVPESRGSAQTCYDMAMRLTIGHQAGQASLGQTRKNNAASHEDHQPTMRPHHVAAKESVDVPSTLFTGLASYSSSDPMTNTPTPRSSQKRPLEATSLTWDRGDNKRPDRRGKDIELVPRRFQQDCGKHSQDSLQPIGCPHNSTWTQREASSGTKSLDALRHTGKDGAGQVEVSRTRGPEAPHPTHVDLSIDQNLLCEVVRRHVVSMRKSDFHLNASQILSAAGLTKSQRDLRVRSLRSQGVTTIQEPDGPEVWVPFRDGVFLCQRVGLESELASLLSWAPCDMPDRQENYLAQVERLEWSGQLIAHRPYQGTINAAHLLRLSGSRQRLGHFFARNPGIKKQVHYGEHRGTYVSYEDARVLCLHLGLDPGPIDDLLGSGSYSRPPDRVVNV
ncbi:hypothetical protein CDD80_4512 [Ophiocordyceps camponoti-rufipedis]|uniref:non-specific serine/threonine protein kinase n=1 Tax=Ophiocordyceps camponoti-rufipedis TaxID=2004952 RepID=A0A2C5YY82_9HYPO|nr:hypothetical protein CDD80_4512 [Ophiocordyceps camponoti-rufipedis]